LRLLQRNYRTPGRGGGEIDLIMQASDGTVVFIEVRQRSRTDHGGAAASIGYAKQRRIIFAAQHYLLRWRSLPPARFDVVTIEATGPQWLQAAFDAS
jgi:putative endonuclease